MNNIKQLGLIVISLLLFGFYNHSTTSKTREQDAILNEKESEPLALVKWVFCDTSFLKEIPQHATGEYTGEFNSKDIKSGTKLEFRVLEDGVSTAVINMTLTDSLGKGLDTYLHLVKKDVWKITALRALAMTGMIAGALKEFEEMSESQIDSLIANNDNEFKSRKELDRYLDNLRLTLELDDNIIKHFEENRSNFNRIVEELSQVKEGLEEKEFRKLNYEKYISTDFRDLLISGVSSSYFCKNCYEFMIGGMIDNTVGYMYISESKDVPKMNPSRLIMIREIGEGWYLFKTT